MKSYLSKLGVLLFGAMFAVASCQDYAEDIRQVNTDLSAKIDAAVADLEKKMATAEALKALEGDLKDLQASVDEAVDGLEAAYKAGDKALQDQFNKAIADANKAISDLSTAYKAADKLIQDDLTAVKGRVTSLEAQIVEVSNKANKNADDIAALATELRAADTQIRTLITELTARVAANEGEIAALKTALAEVKEDLADETAARELLAQKHETDKADLLDKINANKTAIEAEVVARETLATTFETYKTENDQKIAALEQADKDLTAAIQKVADDLAAAKAILDQVVKDLAALTVNVEKALARVQSLVYVPDYSDHKATLDWATVAVERGSTTYPTIISKASDLKYLIKADNAESVATAIAAHPEVLDYVVKGVQTRSSLADLEIVNVTAEKEYIIVSVVAKNFDHEFYLNTEEGAYSAALVLSDEKNTRTTEFTNLVASAEHAEFTMELFVPGEDGALRMAEKNEVINYLMVCNDYKTAKTAVKPVVGFVDVANVNQPATFYTEKYMVEELGYDLTVGMTINITDGDVFDQTRGIEPNEEKMDDPKDTKLFNITESPKYCYTYKVQEGTTFDNVGTKGIVAYAFDCGGVVNRLTYEFELANAQVAINAEVVVDWTVALQESLIDNGVQYGKPLVFEVKEFTSVGGAVTNLWSALSQDKKDTKSYVMVDGAWKESSKIISNKKLTETEAIYQLAATKYSWNNDYKVVFVTTNDDLNVDYTTSIVVKLGGKPSVINVPAITVDLLLNGNNSFFAADVDLFTASYDAIKEKLGYADAAADKAAWTAEFANFIAQNTGDNIPTVNTKVGRASTLNELAEARLSILEHNNGRYEILRGEPNVITYSADSWFGVPFNFTVNANVVLPVVDLIYSEDYVKDVTTDPYAKAEAEIGANGVYSIIQSDLAKYFNVAAESLEGHTYTVNFEVLSPEGNVVSLAKNSTSVEPKGASTYNYLASGVFLNWMNYSDLVVNVKATLLVNDLVLQSRTLKIVAEDPLTLTVADKTITRKHRENTVIKVYDHVVITSTAEPTKANILNIAEANDFDATIKYAKDTYGVDLKLILNPEGVYYLDSNNQKVYVGANKFEYKNGVLTIFGDDSSVVEYIAEFSAKMTSRICGDTDEHKKSFTITVK